MSHPKHIQKIIFVLISLMVGLLFFSAPVQGQTPETTRVLIALRPGSGDGADLVRKMDRAQQRAQTTAGQEPVQLVHQYQTLPGLAAEVTPEGLAELLRQPEVAAVTVDLPVYAVDSPGAIFLNVDDVRQIYGLTGAGVRVAVLDSGVDLTHPDLAGQIVAQQCFNKGGACPPADSAQSDSAQDENGHGTHVSGIIASQGAASPPGLAPDAELVAVRVLDSQGSGYTSDVLAGIDWVVTHQAALQVKIINLSLGGGSYSGVCDAADANTLLYAAAVEAARQAGISVFAAAGNSGQTGALIAPACVGGVIAVGNVYDTTLSQVSWPGCIDSPAVADQVACSSNTSPALDLLAPGTQVWSTWLGGGQRPQSGTSMATPHAAAVAALLLQAAPNLTPAEIEQTLKTSGAPVLDTRTNQTIPRVDALAAVETVSGSQSSQVSGLVLLQGRSDHSGSRISLSEAPCDAAPLNPVETTTGADGGFTLTAAGGQDYPCLRVTQPGYLSAWRESPAGDLGSLTLPAGDINGDQTVNILDLVLIAHSYQNSDPATDVDASGLVDLIDLVLTAQNFNRQGPVLWQALPATE